MEDCWEKFEEDTYDILVIPDAGSNDGKYIENFSFPVLVIDHHIVEKDSYFPSNMILINNQTSERYLNKNLSGAGMVFQFCRALDAFLEKNLAFDFIDLAAVGICGDMMSGLEIENQFFWKVGFSHIRNYFLKVLCEKQAFSMKGYINPISVAFYIVPMLNALIRVGTKEEKQRLFLAVIDGHTKVASNARGHKGETIEVAIESARECTNAKNHQNKEKEEIVSHLEGKIAEYGLLDNQILFIRLEDEDDFPSELNGLVAMQLAARYNHPTIVARLNDEGFIRGSSRGLNNSELESFKDFMDSTGLFEYTAGHDNACGISIANSNLKRLHEIANKELQKYDFGETFYEVEFEMPANSIQLPILINDLERYRDVWSQNCSEPNIHVVDLNVTMDDIDVVGKNSDTLRIHKNGITFIKFFAKDLIKKLKDKNYTNLKIELVGRASVNEWRGTYTPQILIEAIDFKENRVIDF